MRLLYLVTALCAATCGSAMAQSAPPTEIGRMEEKVVSMPKRAVWDTASTWAVSKGFSPNTSDFEGGMVEFVQNVGTPPCEKVAGIFCRPSYGIGEWATCPVSKWMIPRNGMAKVILLLSEEGGQTKIRMETRFVRFNAPSWVRCESTGVLEQDFFSILVE